MKEMEIFIPALVYDVQNISEICITLHVLGGTLRKCLIQRRGTRMVKGRRAKLYVESSRNKIREESLRTLFHTFKGLSCEKKELNIFLVTSESQLWFKGFYLFYKNPNFIIIEESTC